MGRIIIPGGGNNVDLDVITAAASDILKGKIGIGPDGEPLTGTIPSLSAKTITPGKTNQVLNAGNYLAGNITVKGDSNLAAANIKSGKSIFGVSGSCKEFKVYYGEVGYKGTLPFYYKGYNSEGTKRTVTTNYLELTNLGFTPIVLWYMQYKANETCIAIYYSGLIRMIYHLSSWREFVLSENPNISVTSGLLRVPVTTDDWGGLICAVGY